MANPYIVGNPVPYAHLYGRDELIQKCYQQDVNSNIWLLGRRRSGKTSMLLAIEEFALRGKEWFPVYITLAGCDNADDIKEAFGERLQENLSQSGLGEYQPLNAERDFVSLVKAFYEWLKTRQMGLLLLLDEIEQLEKLDGGSRIERRLRELRSGGHLRLRMIIAAARGLRTQKKVVTSPFIDMFKTEYIGAISEIEARRLIRQEKNVKMQATDEVVDKIVTVAACEPYLCQYLCDKLYQPGNRLRAPTDAELKPIDESLHQILTSDYGYLEDKEKEILRRIAQREQMDPSSVPAELIQLGYVKQVNHQYRIGNHFLETWLKANPTQPDESSKQSPLPNQKLSRRLDLAVSLLLPILGFVVLMGGYAFLIAILKLSNFQAVWVALVTAILGFQILIFAGRFTDAIGEATFYKLSLRIIKQIPFLSNLADKLIAGAEALKGKNKNGNSG